MEIIIYNGNDEKEGEDTNQLSQAVALHQ